MIKKAIEGTGLGLAITHRLLTLMNELDKYRYNTDNDLIIWLRENTDIMNFPAVIDKLLQYTNQL